MKVDGERGLRKTDEDGKIEGLYHLLECVCVLEGGGGLH